MNQAGFEGFDRISITGVKAFGHHGVLESERENGQQFVVDVVAHLDFGEAGNSDDLSNTLDYSKMAEVIVACIEGEPLNLIEAVAQRIANSLFDAFGPDDLTTPSRLSILEVTVHKPNAPIEYPFDDVAVTIVRVR